MEELQESSGMSIILITHDLAVVAEIADYVCVMYASKFVEHGPLSEVFKNPKHPYTVALMRSIPHISTEKEKRLTTIEGMVPDPLQHPPGCRFHPRCWLRRGREICEENEPELKDAEEGHSAACHFSGEVLQRKRDTGIGRKGAGEKTV
jgi:oligopeptide/dipeptide ABC transporter ATP-binding protein